MRVCIIGDVSEPLDEGMKKTTHALSTALSKYCDVLVLNPLRVGRIGFWTSLLHYRPDIIHYVPGPSLYSFALLALTGLITSAITVMSLTHPKPNLPRRFACRFFRPDLVLSQSLQTEKLFRDLGCNIHYMPNGVDTRQFQPIASQVEKFRLRHKYGVSPEAFVVLHVGNTRQVRNLDVLTELQHDGCQVVVVSSTTIQGDSSVDIDLTAAGCLLWNRYIPAIEEVYKLADCYVFPTPTGIGAIEHPLSVMEAMACNLPVITKRFGALPRIFTPGDGLYFVDTDAELKAEVKQVQYTENTVATRDKVIVMNWDAIARQILTQYQGLKTMVNSKATI
jgi:glycosyltransferase involved in cell wall biosynthesis